MAAKIVSRGDPIEPIYLNNLRVAAQDWGYDSGLAVSQKGAGANMSVDVSAGGAWINDTRITKGSITNVVITAAHATYDRYDLVVINSSGTISVIDGTAAAVSYANDYDLQANNAILLSEVYVPATDTTIEDAQITDQRIKTTTLAAGTVGMFHGLIADIQSGWLICDGTNGTPDLRDTFVRGAANLADSGATGGADTHMHSLTATDTGASYNHESGNNQWLQAGSTVPAFFALLYIMKL